MIKHTNEFAAKTLSSKCNKSTELVGVYYDELCNGTTDCWRGIICILYFICFSWLTYLYCYIKFSANVLCSWFMLLVIVSLLY